MIKIDTDFNVNVLLNLFFSLSKKIIFSSPILANNNLPLKIYCENIAISFPISFSFLFFLFFSPLFLSSTHVVPHFFFSFFYLLHTHTLTLLFFYFFPLLQPTTSSKLRTFQLSFFLFFFFFFLSSFLPLLKIYPYSYLFYPSFLYFSFTFFWSLFFPEHSIDS